MSGSANPKVDLDPFRAVLGVIAGLQDSDLLMHIVNTTGLVVPLTMTREEAYSHKTRVRTLLPRIYRSYEELDDQPKLAVARAALTTLVHTQRYETIAAQATEVLSKIGWELQDTELVASTPDLREMFFPKGSPWDAFVVLRDIFAEAQREIIIVDAYSDGTIFKMLATRPLEFLAIKILCSRYADAVAAEARTFMMQHRPVSIEVRKTRDFHDRFIIVDGNTCVHVGASIKDAGKTAFMISKIEDEQNRTRLLSSVTESWDAATPVTQ